jgi:hypothetical protein
MPKINATPATPDMTILREEDFYRGVNSLKEEAINLANRCHRQLTDLEFLQCVAAKFGVESFAEYMLKTKPEDFFKRYGHQPEAMRTKP